MLQPSLMSRSLIKYVFGRKDKLAFTLIEILFASVIAVSLMAIVIDFYMLSNKTYSTGVTKQWLQDDANIILAKITEGKSEPGGVFRLCEAVSYSIAGISELHFTGTDGIQRWFQLNNSSTALIYHHPTASGNIDETIYTAPAGAAITLRFFAQYTGVVVGIDAALTMPVSGKTVSGSASTYVTIRNHSVP